MYLLDANALIALLWPAHAHHERAMVWFTVARNVGWCTCALTQAAFVRVLAQPAFHAPAVSIDDASRLLTQNTVASDHQHLPVDVALVDVLTHCTGGVVGHRQVTDAWLITLANKRGARLATFDRRMSTLLATDAERSRDLLFL
jgi:uncharacterized protein